MFLIYDISAHSENVLLWLECKCRVSSRLTVVLVCANSQVVLYTSNKDLTKNEAQCIYMLILHVLLCNAEDEYFETFVTELTEYIILPTLHARDLTLETLKNNLQNSFNESIERANLDKIKEAHLMLLEVLEITEKDEYRLALEKACSVLEDVY